MSKRLIVENVEPAAFQALLQLESYLANISIPKTHQHLIKIRASQINGCEFCIDMHTGHALQAGIPQQKIDLISEWEGSEDSFSDDERLIFAITEEVTLINKRGLSDELYKKSELSFGQQKTVQIIMTIITINAWNRLVISLKSSSR